MACRHRLPQRLRRERVRHRGWLPRDPTTCYIPLLLRHLLREREDRITEFPTLAPLRRQ
jgi:hypothetical protein